MTDEELDEACRADGLTEGQRQAREFVVAARALEQAQERWRAAFMDLRLNHLDDAACALVAQALDQLGLEPVGSYVTVMARNAALASKEALAAAE